MGKTTLHKGSVIGFLVLRDTDTDDRRKHVCECVCGNIKSIWKTSLVAKTVFSCGCKKQDLRVLKITKSCNTETKRECCICKHIYSIEEFGTQAMVKKEYRCRTCRISRHTWLDRKRKYNITKVQFEEIMESQNGLCAVCSIDLGDLLSKHICVDHCHDTGIVRGILCTNCNFLLGHSKDNIQTLVSAIKYLKDNLNKGILTC